MSMVKILILVLVTGDLNMLRIIHMYQKDKQNLVCLFSLFS